MKLSPALLVATLLALGPAACDGSSKGASSEKGGVAPANSAATPSALTHTTSTATTQASSSSTASWGLEGDEDDDDTPANTTPGNSTGDDDADFDNDLPANRGKGYRDDDDLPITAFGNPAPPAESRAISSLATRYYAAAATADGATACRLMYSTIEAAIVEDYGSGAGPAHARGKSCPEVMSKIFAHAHAQLTGRLMVTDVRAKGNWAYALIGSHAQPAARINVRRERGAWKVDALVGSPLP